MGLIPLLTSERGRSLHLPAHGRGAALPSDLREMLRHRAGIWDLPELPELGGPLMQRGEVAESQRQAAVAIGAERGWYGVNGATGLLQAALLAMARPGQAVLMPRNVHRSLIQACVLGELTPVLFDLPFMVDRGHVYPPNRTWFHEVLNELPKADVEIAAAVLVHPTYQGYATDIKPMVDELHGLGLPVLVDEAHGAHFASRVDEELPDSAITAGADLIVHSLHKSAAGLAQTAVLWWQGNRVDPIAVERSLGWLQTTSPSALLLASCEAALSEWHNPAGLRKLRARLDEARELTSRLRDLGLPLLENQDPLRLILHTAAEGISGIDADAWLMSRRLVAELPEPGCLTFCLGLAPQRGLVRLMHRCWGGLLAAYGKGLSLPAFAKPPLPRIAVPAMPCGLAWRAQSHKVPIAEAVGSVSTELICPYPPGIPLLVPGEKLDQRRVDWLLEQHHFWPDQIAGTVKVLAF